MKQLILIIANLAILTQTYAQNRPDATEQRGDLSIHTYRYFDFDDSVRFTIRGKNDTILTEKWSRNGKLSSQQWGKDSVYTYQQLTFGDDEMAVTKQFAFDKKDNEALYFNNADSIVSLYRNGQIMLQYARRLGWGKVYYENGKLKSAFEEGKNDQNQKRWMYSLRKEYAENGNLYQSERFDSIIRQHDTIMALFDTTFFANGRIYSIHHAEYDKSSNRSLPMYLNQKRSPSIKFEIYDENGKKRSFFPPDSLAVEPFKDNVDCYYGFKNGRGDTVVVPKYDRIEALDADLFAAYQASRCTVHRVDGTVLPTPPVLTLIEKMQVQEETRKMSNFHKTELTDYFFVKTNGKIAVIDRTGQVVVPPQYEVSTGLMFGQVQSDFRCRYVGNMDFILFEEWRTSDSSFHSVVLNRLGQSVFPSHYKSIIYTGYKDLFIVARRENQMLGLSDGSGQLVLDEQFSGIEKVANSSLFKVVRYYGQDSFKLGLFDAATRRWVLDTAQIFLQEIEQEKTTRFNAFGEKELVKSTYYFNYQNEKTRKMGIIDEQGRTILAAEYDTIVTGMSKIWNGWYRKGQNVQFFEYKNLAKTRKQYTFLTASQTFDIETKYFVAQSNGKWGVVDQNDSVIIAFEFDYVGKPIGFGDFTTIFVKNNQAYLTTHQNFPKISRHFSFDRMTNGNFTTTQKTLYLAPFDKPNQVFCINATGQVVIPPQYERLWSNDFQTDYVVLRDAKGQKKIGFTENGRIVDYPFDYDIAVAKAESPLIITTQRDTSTEEHHSFYGIVTTEGKELEPCKNFGIAIGDAKTGIYFAKKKGIIPESETELLEMTAGCNDTLGRNDSTWLMFNANGRLLNPQPFRFSIAFKNGLGVGMQGEKFGIFRNNGTHLIPPQYPMLRYDDSTGLFVAYEYIGLQPNILLYDEAGRNRLSRVRYDGISKFLGKYALVKQVGKVGIIDSLGNEIIAPQDLRRPLTVNFADTILIELAQKGKLNEIEVAETVAFNIHFSTEMLPDLTSTYWHPDSLKLSPPLRTALWHLMLEKCLDAVIFGINDWQIKRAESSTTIQESVSCPQQSSQVWKVSAADRFISFLFDNEVDVFHNFHKKNGRWEDLTPLQMWKNDPLSTQAFYEALVAKIRTMKHVDIDCSDRNYLISRAQKQFLVAGESVKIYLDAKDDFNALPYVPIEFTWAELKPFIRSF